MCKPKAFKMCICCNYAKHTSLRRKGKDLLAQTQDNVSEWSDMSACSPRFLCRPTAFFFDLLEPWDVRELYIWKTADLPLQLCVDTFPRFVWLTLSDFIFYPKPLYKSLHQSFFYSFITILPSESGVALDYSTIFP